MTVLIVDDSGPMRRALKALVDDLADTVYECADGAGALAAKGGAVPELLALIYALQRLGPGAVLPDAVARGLEKGEAVGQAEWAQAAGELDMTVWRTGARRALQSHPVVVRAPFFYLIE